MPIVFQKDNDTYLARIMSSSMQEMVFLLTCHPDNKTVIRDIYITIAPLAIDRGCEALSLGQSCRCSEIHAKISNSLSLQDLVLQICPERRVVTIEGPGYSVPLAHSALSMLDSGGATIPDAIGAIRHVGLVAMHKAAASPDTVRAAEFILQLFHGGQTVHFIEDGQAPIEFTLPEVSDFAASVPKDVRMN